VTREEAHIYLRLIVASIRARMEYKTTFLFLFLALMIFYLAQVGVILVVLTKFGAVAGWTLGEMAFLYGLMVFSQGVTTVFFGSLNDFESLIISGDFDRLLVRPLSPLGQILAGGFEISATAHFTIGATALYFGSKSSGVEWTVEKAMYLPVVILGAVLIQGGLRLGVSAICFWTIRNRSLVHTLIYSSKEMIFYPISIYHWGMQLFLTVMFPLAFINFYPSHYFLSKSGSALLFHPYIQYATPLVGIMVFAAAYAVWKFGIKRYQSTGN
jgi:ABC-2 type transport system permease protein